MNYIYIFTYDNPKIIEIKLSNEDSDYLMEHEDEDFLLTKGFNPSVCNWIITEDKLEIEPYDSSK